jgi:hypothetical protein
LLPSLLLLFQVERGVEYRSRGNHGSVSPALAGGLAGWSISK